MYHMWRAMLVQGATSVFVMLAHTPTYPFLKKPLKCNSNWLISQNLIQWVTELVELVACLLFVSFLMYNPYMFVKCSTRRIHHMLAHV